MKQKFIVSAGAVLLYGIPLVVAAAATDVCGIFSIANKVKTFFATAVLLISIFMMLYAAFLFLTGGGNEEALTKAKATLVWGIVGIAVALLSFNAITIIKSVVGSSVATECGFQI